MIRAVIFDIDNTLYSYTDAHAYARAALLKYASRNFGWDAAEFTERHDKAMADVNSRLDDVAAIHNRMIRYQNMLEAAGLPLEPHALAMYELYWDELMKYSVPSEGAAELMESLKKQGVRLGAGTDMTARMQFKKLSAMGYLKYLDFMVTSEEAGVEKPARALFSRCVEKAGAAPEECLFIGDNDKKDIAGALGVGMKAAWYRPGLTDHAGSNAAGKDVTGKDNAVNGTAGNGTAGNDAAEIRTPWTDSRGVIIFRSFRELPAVIGSL